MEAVVVGFAAMVALGFLSLLGTVATAALLVGPSVIRDPWEDWGLDDQLTSTTGEYNRVVTFR